MLYIIIGSGRNVTPYFFYYLFIMKRNPNTVNLTKDYIESKISQELIVSKYLGIDIEVIKNCIEHNVLITSVFRDNDLNGSLGFQYNNKGRLKVRDFGGIFWGDVYDVVAYILSIVVGRQINISNKQDFYYVLKHIAYTFSNIIDGKEVDPNNDILISNAINKAKTSKSIIELVTRSWNNHDKEIWSKWGISLNYLNTHFVVPVEQYYINRYANPEPKYIYKNKDECYAYILGMNKKGIYNIKLYFPTRDKTTQLKFITNCNCLEGILNLELYNYDYILITKSTKDRLSIGNHLLNRPFYGGDGNKLNIGIVNLPSENYELKQEEYDYLNNKLSKDGMIFSLLDFDYTGRKGAKYLKDNYNIPYLFITRGEFGLENYSCKDFADLCENYSNDVINEFIGDTIKYINLKYKQDYEDNFK